MSEKAEVPVLGDLRLLARKRLIEQAAEILSDHHADLCGLDPVIEGREDDLVVNIVFNEDDEPVVQLTSVFFDSDGRIIQSGTQYGVLTL